MNSLFQLVNYQIMLHLPLSTVINYHKYKDKQIYQFNSSLCAFCFWHNKMTLKNIYFLRIQKFFRNISKA